MAGLLPDRFRIVGSARRALTVEQFREHARQSVAEFGTSKPAGEAWSAFERALSFGSAKPDDTAPPAAAIGRAEEELGGPGERGRHRLRRPWCHHRGFLAKEPGAQMSLGAAQMTFRYQDSFRAANGLEGYERLILDAMLGDQTLFTRTDDVERSWEVSVPLLDHPPPVQPHPPGSWGPEPSLRRLAAPFRRHLPGAGSVS